MRGGEKGRGREEGKQERNEEEESEEGRKRDVPDFEVIKGRLTSLTGRQMVLLEGLLHTHTHTHYSPQAEISVCACLCDPCFPVNHLSHMSLELAYE